MKRSCSTKHKLTNKATKKRKAIKRKKIRIKKLEKERMKTPKGREKSGENYETNLRLNLSCFSTVKARSYRSTQNPHKMIPRQKNLVLNQKPPPPLAQILVR